jgi:hypothetical protein
MGDVRETEKALLFAAIFSSTPEDLQKASGLLQQEYGQAAASSEIYDFSHTEYYREEMGGDLLKQLVLFPHPFDPGRLAEIKLHTNQLEEQLSSDGRRTVNLDPGYITLAKVILATTKNYSHRIYIGSSIYAEITLGWQKEGFEPQAWTYADYRMDLVIAFFNTCRGILNQG